jgi:hypothetical protein
MRAVGGRFLNQKPLPSGRGGFTENEEAFWDGYCRWALGRWREAVRELTAEELQSAYRELGWEELPPKSSSTAWKRDAERRASDDAKRAALWRAANRQLVCDWLVHLPPDQWRVKELVQKHGLERMRYLLLHFPLPDELERYRTEALRHVVRRESGETGVLFERIGQLGAELDRARRRAEQLGALVRDLRNENAALSAKLAEARRRIQELENSLAAQKSGTRDPEDVRRIARLKGLVAELRAEVKRLAALLPAEENPPVEAVEELSEAPVAPEKRIDLSVLTGKTVGVFGRLGEAMDAPCEVLWHDGDRADGDLEAILVRADIFVVLTRLVSHEVMWRVKEEAADTGKPVAYVRETGIARILEAAARAVVR